MATILSKKKSSSGGPYVFYTVSTSVYGRTPTAVKLKFEVTAWLQYSSSLLGKGMPISVSLYVGGAWRKMTLKSSGEVWTGTTKHSVTSKEITISGLSPGTTTMTGIKFKAEQTGGSAGDLNSTSCSNIKIPSVTAEYSSVNLTGSALNQATATAKISGLPTAVGYAQTIKWMLGSSVVKTVSIAASSKATSYSHTFTGLKPSSKYNLTVQVYGGSTLLSTKTVAVTTPAETGTLVLTPKSTYITAQVGGMFSGPSYVRTIVFSYKRSTETTYKTFETIATGSGQSASVAMNITGLVSNVKYDIEVQIKNGATVLKTLKATATTLKDTSLVPVPEIAGVEQRLGTRECTVGWFVNKNIAKTTYTVQVKTAAASSWANIKTLSSVSSPVTVTAPAGNADVSFRIAAANVSVASSVTNYSEIFTVYVRDDFEWDIEKAEGAKMVITANEWNRLGDYAMTKCAQKGITVDIPKVSAGEKITAETYNVMKNAITKLSVIPVGDKVCGDPIVAEDIDALRIAVNA